MVLFILLSGCARKQEVNPLRSEIEGKICIIEDIKVREGFLPVLKSALEELGYQVSIVSPNSAISNCETTVTYKGLWSWDVTIYLGYANISAYKNGALIGSAEYKSAKLSLRKWVNAENKIRELVKEIFPPRLTL